MMQMVVFRYRLATPSAISGSGWPMDTFKDKQYLDEIYAAG
jgi:hypothetical protein